MSLEKFPIIGQNNAANHTELPKESASPELKLCAKKVSTVAGLIAQLNELETNPDLTPDDIDVQLYQISKRLDRLDAKERRAVLKLYNSTAYNATFPIMKELYERN